MEKNNIEQKEIGRRLQIVRKQLGLLQRDVAEQIGVSSLTISRIERGEDVHATTLSSLLGLYSKHISLNTLYANSFPENIEEALTTNRIDIPKNLLKDMLLQMLKQQKDMYNALEHFKTEFLGSLDQTIKLL